MSSISADSNLSSPRLGHVWRADHGQVYASVYLSSSGTSALYFDSAEDARAVAAACEAAAQALEKLVREQQ